MVSANKLLPSGSLFAVPLPNGGWGAGLAARRSRRGGVVLGYFSKQRFDVQPSLEEAAFLPSDAAWVTLFGDLGVIEGRWKVLGVIAEWVPDEWPVPDFARVEEFSNRCFRVRYDGGDLDSDPLELPATEAEVAHLPEAGLAGAGFVEARLQRLLTDFV